MKVFMYEELQEMRVKPDLRDICKELGIRGYSNMTKETMVQAILAFQMEGVNLPEELENASRNEKRDFTEATRKNTSTAATNGEMSIAQNQTTANHGGNSRQAVESVLKKAVLGQVVLANTFVAYRYNGRLTTGKILETSVENGTIEKLTVESVSRKVYEIDKESVLWLKLGAKWPAFIYDELKANVEKYKKLHDLKD